MKKISSTLLAVLLLGVSFVQTGCLGKFSLVKKVYKLNLSVGDKYMQNVVFWVFCIVPLYKVAGIIDILFLNVIEFWTGSNPISMKEGDIQIQTLTMNGDKYEVTASKNKFHFKQLTGNNKGHEAELVFNTVDKSWNLKNSEQSVKLMEFIEKDGVEMVNILKPNGSVYATKLVVDNELMMAQSN